MSDYIHFEIQVEIIKWIPDVKTLLQFRSVSKPWKSLIDSPKFIADFHTRHPNHRLLLGYSDSPGKYVSVPDDDIFPQHEMTDPRYVNLLNLNIPTQYVNPVTSQGLFFFYYTHNNAISDSFTVLLWNPAVRKSVEIVVPSYLLFKTAIGFGVSPHTNDPMLVMIKNREKTTSCHVEVFTLSTGVWRSCLSTNRLLPRNSVQFSRNHVVIDRFIYWVGVDSCDGDHYLMPNVIMSFDMTSEEFSEISLPNCLARSYDCSLELSKLGESLVVLESDNHEATHERVVWIMERGVPNPFRKLFTIKAPHIDSDKYVFGFRKSGEPIIEGPGCYGPCDMDNSSVNCDDDSCSQRFKDIPVLEDACIDYIIIKNLLKRTAMNTQLTFEAGKQGMETKV